MGKDEEKHTCNYQSYEIKDPQGTNSEGKVVYAVRTHHFCSCGNSYNEEHGLQVG
jgi:hypothetical protein